MLLLIVMITMVLSRNFSFKAETNDVMTRCAWCTDPLLLWEKVFGQKIKAGFYKKTREKKALLESK